MQDLYIDKNSLVVLVEGELDQHMAGILRARIDPVLAREGIRDIIYDFSKTEFMDSSGIGVLIGRKKTMDMHRGEICARNLGERAQKILSADRWTGFCVCRGFTGLCRGLRARRRQQRALQGQGKACCKKGISFGWRKERKQEECRI